MMRVSEQLAIFCGLGIPVFFRAAEILLALVKGEYDYRVKGRFNRNIHFWFWRSYILLLGGSAVINLIELILGEKKVCWFLNFWFALALSVGIELFFWAAYRLLNAYRSRQARRRREKWRAATGAPLDLQCPPEPDRAPRQGYPYNGVQIDFASVYDSDGLPIAWTRRESQLIRTDVEKAAAYLKQRTWFRGIVRSYYGMGIGGVFGVFLFQVETDSPEDDAFLWVVAGDVPATHFSCENARTPRQALRKYLDAMNGRWQNGADDTTRAVRVRLELLEQSLRMSTE